LGPVKIQWGIASKSKATWSRVFQGMAVSSLRLVRFTVLDLLRGGQLQTRCAQPTISVMGVGNIFSYGRSMMIQGLNSLKNWMEKTGVYMGGCKNGGQLARIIIEIKVLTRA
jgi:hypothetical protein